MYRYISAIFLMFVLHSANSQSFKAELTAGATANQLDGDNLGGYKKFGFCGGGGVSIGFTEKLSLGLQALYIQKGSREANEFRFFSWRINYLQLPLYLDYELSDRFHVKGGLAADILINSRRDATGAGFADITSEMRRVCPVFVGGVGYELSDRLGINMMYNYSLLSVARTQYLFTNTVAATLTLKLADNK